MEMRKTVYCTDCESWREWLGAHHASEREVWLLYPKKHTGKPCVSYTDALDEALCHGWIDSLIQRVDDDWYARKFTPRTDHQNWSDVNMKRVAGLMKEGRMLPAGIAKLGNRDRARQKPAVRPNIKSFKLSPVFARDLKKNSKAWKNFENLAPSHKQRFVVWIMSAKQDETRRRRLKDAIGLLAANQKLGLK